MKITLTPGTATAAVPCERDRSRQNGYHIGQFISGAPSVSICMICRLSSRS